MRFLEEGTCLEKCSGGRFLEGGGRKCLECDKSCLTCRGTEKTCTACGLTGFLHLRGS